MSCISQSRCNRLPVEILARIFRFSILRPVAIYEPEERWTICRVCRYWRNIMLHTPLLWDDISLDVWSKDPISGEIYSGTNNLHIKDPLRASELLSTALLASAQRSLHVTFVCGPPTNVAWLPVFSVLMEHMRRIRSLKVDARTFHHLIDNVSIFSWRLASEASHLEVLELVDQYDPFQFEYPSEANVALTQSLVPHLTNLHTLILRALPAFCDQDLELVPPFPWHQITHLEIECFTRDDIVDVLSRCSRLRALVLREDYFADFEDIAPWDIIEPVHLETLRHLRIPVIHANSQLTSAHLLSTLLYLPALESIEVPRIWVYSDLEIVRDIVLRSGCDLKTIDVDMLHISDVSVERLLKLTPNLNKLVFRGQVSPHLFGLMKSNKMVPNLRELYVLFAEDQSGTVGLPLPPLGAIFDAARSLRCLRSLHVETCKEVLTGDLLGDDSYKLPLDFEIPGVIIRVDTPLYSELVAKFKLYFRDVKKNLLQVFTDTFLNTFHGAAHVPSSRIAEIVRENFVVVNDRLLAFERFLILNPDVPGVELFGYKGALNKLLEIEDGQLDRYRYKETAARILELIPPNPR
ncbi:hypothetical protein VNI00_019249 [Paramarasmius palmivorus]|uniref:F-box domain-containing protein n=1 Tax=Paramarasmius palmivorus TaxID=297713 RepID=A0AAW0AP22_9AGAR